MKKFILIFSFLTVCSFLLLAQEKSKSSSIKSIEKFTENFMMDSCTFQTTGRNTYFILEPGFQLILEGKEGKDSVRLEIMVLKETIKIGNVETRIVEEKEFVNHEIVEISRNYFAFCKETRSFFYFGEEVDNYNKKKIINHSGSWKAEGQNKAGIIMPGLILLGAKYYQELAPGVAMDRAEIVNMGENFLTQAGMFTNVITMEETTPLEPEEKEYKLYAPGVGLIKEGELMLVKYGVMK